MPMFKVYVGNLDPRTTVETLKPYFEPFGDAVDEIVLVTDKDGQPRGFAIVLFRDPQRGQLAIETLTGKRINGREIQINESVKKSKRVQSPDKGPRNSPLGPRAFQRPGSGFRSGGGRPGGRAGPGPGGGRPGFGASAGGGGTFNRNPRRVSGQAGGEGGAAGGAAPGPGSRPIGGGVPRPGSRPLGGAGPQGGRPPLPGGGSTQSRPLGFGGRPGVPSPASRPLSSRPPAPPSAQPPAPPPSGTGEGDSPATPARPKAAKKKPPTEA